MTSVPTERRSERGWGHELDVVLQIAESFEFEPRLVAPPGHHAEVGSRGWRSRAGRFLASGSLGTRLGRFVDAHRTALVVVGASVVAGAVAGRFAALPVSAAVVGIARVANRVWAMVLAALFAGLASLALGGRAPLVLGLVLWGIFGLAVLAMDVTERVNRRRTEPRWAPAWVEGPRRVSIEVLKHDTPWHEIHPAKKI